MWPLPDLSHRVETPELMDDRAIGGPVLVEALAQLRTINRLLGAEWPTVEGVARLWRQAGSPAQLSVLDVGAGSGDLSRGLLRWAAWVGVELQLTLLDIHPETCAVAADRYRDVPRVTVVAGDVYRLPVRADIVTAALFTHHFPDRELPDVLCAMRAAARQGVVVNDLHRHWFAYGFVWCFTRLLSRNPMIRNDGPLSVRRGFRAADLERLRRQPGLEGLTYAWRPWFRYLALLPGTAGSGPDWPDRTSRPPFATSGRPAGRSGLSATMPAPSAAARDQPAATSDPRPDSPGRPDDGQ